MAQAQPLARIGAFGIGLAEGCMRDYWPYGRTIRRSDARWPQSHPADASPLPVVVV